MLCFFPPRSRCFQRGPGASKATITAANARKTTPRRLSGCITCLLRVTVFSVLEERDIRLDPIDPFLPRPPVGNAIVIGPQHKFPNLPGNAIKGCKYLPPFTPSDAVLYVSRTAAVGGRVVVLALFLWSFLKPITRTPRATFLALQISAAPLFDGERRGLRACVVFTAVRIQQGEQK